MTYFFSCTVWLEPCIRFACSLVLLMSPKMGPKAKAGVLKKPAAAKAKAISGLSAKVGPEIKSSALESLAKIKEGNYERKDMQNATNHLKSLAAQGRPEVLASYKKCKTNKDRHDFLSDLALDPDGGFISITEVFCFR